MPRPAAPLPISERAARLRYTPLFEDLPTHDLRRLAEACGTVEADPGEVVVAQGEEGDTLYVVVRGLLRAERVDRGGHLCVLQDIHKGEFFGEFALLDDVRRSASVVVRSDATLMTLSRAHFEALAGRHPEIVGRVRARLEHRRSQHVDRADPDRAEILRRVSALLEGVSPDILADLDARLESVRVPAGTEIITEGAEGDCMFLVCEGLLHAWVRAEDGTQRRVGEIRALEPVGEAALVSDTPRNATVRAATDCDLLRLTRSGFDTLVGRHPRLDPLVRRVVERRRHVTLARTRSTEEGTGAIPTPDEIEAVILDPDPVRRNHGITRLYHRIGVGLSRLLGDEDVNWPLFGARASYTAGFTIRKEDLRLLEVADGSAWLRARGWLIDRLIRNSVVDRRVNEILSTVSDALAAGNLRIFAEIGSVLGRFLAMLGEDEAYDGERLAAFLGTLVDGPVETGGQDLLKRALTRWYEAAFEEDPDVKAEKLFLGNCLLALHEQTRVQPDIDEALEAPLRLAQAREPGRWLLDRTALGRLPLRAPLQRIADRVERAFLRSIAHVLRQGTTRLMMRLRLPDGDLWLGRPVGKAISTPLSDELATIDLPEVRSFLEPHGRGRPRGATDWGSLPDRMAYIVGLFRAVQKDRALYEPPPAPS